MMMMMMIIYQSASHNVTLLGIYFKRKTQINKFEDPVVITRRVSVVER